MKAYGCYEHQKSACSATASISLELKRLPPCCNTLIRFPSRMQWVLGKDLTLSGFADISISWGRQGLAALGCRSSLWKWERVGLRFSKWKSRTFKRHKHIWVGGCGVHRQELFLEIHHDSNRGDHNHSHSLSGVEYTTKRDAFSKLSVVPSCFVPAAVKDIPTQTLL